MKKIIGIILSAVLLINPMSIFAYDNVIYDDEKISAKAVVLMNLKSGEVLYEKNEYEELSPASVTKIMSILLVLEALDRGDIDLLDDVSASKEATLMGGSQIWLEVGEVMTVNELLKAVIVASANDACTALGEYVAGSSGTFVNMMNNKAKELGLKHTNFENCTGLDDTTSSHYSCAYDLGIIACEVMKYDVVKEYSTIWLDSLRNGETELNNTNKLVNHYDGITGLKTGTTSKAGFCVAATASRNDVDLVAVVLGSDTSDKRFDTATYLLDMGFANYKAYCPEFDLEKLSNISVKNGKVKTINASVDFDNSLLLPNSAKEIEYNYCVPEYLQAPVKEGDIIGYVELKCENEIIQKLSIVANDTVEKLSFWDVVLLLVRNI